MDKWGKTVDSDGDKSAQLWGQVRLTIVRRPLLPKLSTRYPPQITRYPQGLSPEYVDNSQSHQLIREDRNIVFNGWGRG